MAGYCVFCGGKTESRDHCPSRVLLDEPLPPNLPNAEACHDCNRSFSLDEEYLACFLECVICGSVNPAELKREKIKRILADKPALANQINNCKQVDSTGNSVWQADVKRVKRILLKLARGHLAYELNLPRIDEPQFISFTPLVLMSSARLESFESAGDKLGLFPEIGSRAFVRAFEPSGCWNWQIIQAGRYRYMVGQGDGDFAQIVLSEYLACRVQWD